MKNLIAFILLLVSGNILAQEAVVKPAITDIGKPDGEKATMSIGKDGGSITSADGKVKLVIPAGAVTKKTNFSIQPATNLMPNGIGKSYQFEPAGMIFQQPLLVIFYYAGDEDKSNSAELLDVATQNEQGQWLSPTKVTTDTVSKTLTAEAWHFSSFVAYYAAEIRPLTARVKVNGSLRLQIIGITNYDPGKVYENGKEVPLKVKTESAEIWKVNDIVKGNSVVGRISASQNYTAIYQAPAQVPSQNPVAVTVQENNYGNASYDRWRVPVLVAHITIYDGDYEVKMISSMDGMAGSQLGAVRYKDSGSFIIALNEKEPKVTSIENENAYFTYKGKCTVVQLQPGSGNINILGVQSIKLIPAVTPQDNPWIEIFFVRSPTIFPLLQFTCPQPSGRGTYTANSAFANGISFQIPAFPQSIKFEAKDGEQTILQFGEEGGKIYARFTVTKLKEERPG
jgi:hypothetical protein